MKIIDDVSLTSDDNEKTLVISRGSQEIVKVFAFDIHDIKFTTLINDTDISIAYFIFNIISELGICSWYRFDALSKLEPYGRSLNINGYHIHLTDRSAIQHRNCNVILRLTSNEKSIDYDSLFNAAIATTTRDVRYVPNLYQYTYLGTILMDDKTEPKYREADAYNIKPFNITRHKRGELNDDELTNMYINEITKSINSDSTVM